MKKEEVSDDDDAWGKWAGCADTNAIDPKAEECDPKAEDSDQEADLEDSDLEADHDDGGGSEPGSGGESEPSAIPKNLLKAVATKLNWLCRHGWKEYHLKKTHNMLNLNDVVRVIQNYWIFQWCKDLFESEHVVLKVIHDTTRNHQRRFRLTKDGSHQYVQCIPSKKEARKPSKAPKGKGKGKLSKGSKIKVRSTLASVSNKQARGSAGREGARFGVPIGAVVHSPRARADLHNAPIARAPPVVPLPPPPPPPPPPPLPAHPCHQEVVVDGHRAEADEAEYIYGTVGGPKLVGKAKPGPKPVGIVKSGPKPAGASQLSGQSLLRPKAACVVPPHFLPGGFLAPPPREF